MVAIETALSLAGGFVMGAGAVVFAAGRMVGSVTTAVKDLTRTVDLLRVDVLALTERLHGIDKEHAVTRAKLESLNGCLDDPGSEP